VHFRNDFHLGRHIEILDLHYALLRTAVTQRIVIDFDKAVDVIDVALCSLQPGNVVIVPGFELPVL
jgi:hypothetical protein